MRAFGPILCLLLALAPAPVRGQSAELAETYGRSAALYARGRLAEAEPLARRAVELAERELGSIHPGFVLALDNLAAVLAARGRHGEAAPLYRRALAIREGVLGRDDPDVARSLNNLAETYRELGRGDLAAPLYRRALAIRERTLGPDHPDVAVVLGNLALLFAAEGRYEEAEPLLRRALAIRENAFGPDHPDVALSLNNLAELYRSEGRYAPAEPLLERALAIWEGAYGPDHPLVAAALNNLALLYRSQGRYPAAEPLLKRALAATERALGPEHGRVARALGNLAALYQLEGRHAAALPLFERALATAEGALGPDHPDVAAALSNLGTLHASRGRAAAAVPLFERAAAIAERALGPRHPDVAAILGNLAGSYAAAGRYDLALARVRRATAMLRARAVRAAGRRSPGALAERRVVRGTLLRHLEIADAAAGRRPERRTALAAESFEVAQLTRASSAAAAVAGMAARFAAGDDALAGIVRRREAKLDRWRRLDGKIVAAAGRPPAARDREAEQRWRAEQAAVEAELATLDATLAASYPGYAEIVAPRPVSLADARSMLAADEALLIFAVAEARTFVIATGPGGTGFAAAALPAEDLRDAVAELRAVLDPGDAPGARELIDRGFDGRTAFLLYDRLIRPVEGALAGARHVFVVPDDALQSLPLAVLLTAPPEAGFADFRDYAGAPWLVRRYAFTTLPSVSSLRALRRFAGRARARRPFLGVGDPALEGRPGRGRGIAAARVFRGAATDVAAVRALPPLPETADELRAIAASLGAGEDSLLLGEAASERRVRGMDLADRRVVAFATHGLVSGDLGQGEPALVLTPPGEGSAADDGLLTASEIARDLRLDADWVILSACNTAAGDAPGAEGLTGLAKAFFRAGARALLVSHWPVDSGAAVRLTTGLFRAARADPGIGRAEALRRAMLALLADPDTPRYAHPLFWAPFVVVGEGGAGRS